MREATRSGDFKSPFALSLPIRQRHLKADLAGDIEEGTERIRTRQNPE